MIDIVYAVLWGLVGLSQACALLLVVLTAVILVERGIKKEETEDRPGEEDSGWDS